MSRRSSRLIVAALMVATLASLPMRASSALLTDAEAVDATLGAASSFGGVVYRLHDSPTPPVGDTNAQANLPMTVTMPASEPLWNYDADLDSAAGRTIALGGSGAGESNLARYQNWRAPAVSGLAQILNGTITVRLWSGLEDFGPGAGELRIFLRDFNPLAGGTYLEIANATLTQADWQGGSGGWVRKTVTLDVSNYILLVGHQLELKVIVGAASSADIWLAYDTVSYPSDVRLP
jgi:hypothetical protein